MQPPMKAVRATVTVKEILANRRRVVLETCFEVNGLVVVEGTAAVMPTNAEARRKEADNAQDHEA
ncbi:hypothetical protein [Burkholderia sp. AU15512]|uniref:hypothetical protein n=2 Tax=unclassified Burkholderia TaxID=2613784 RepID=UPI00211B4EDF|nr:hypothetical protein [Burkholderia sp. AU15512]